MRADLEDSMMNICQRNSQIFQSMWEAGAALEDDTTQLVDVAARSVYAAAFLQENSGFFIKRTAKKIRKEIETAMTQAGLQRNLALRVKEITENSLA